MTVMLPIGRTAQLAARTSILVRLHNPSTSLRALWCSNIDARSRRNTRDGLSSRLFSHTARNNDPEASNSTVGRPKAHTGRTSARSKSTSNTTTAKKAAGGRKGGRATKSTAKTATKKVTKKPKKVKAKVKAKPGPKKKKAPSATALKRKEREDRKTLRATALLEEPKRLPDNAYLVYYLEERGNATGNGSLIQVAKDVAANYKNVTPEQRERLNHIANQNRAQNDIEYKKWVARYTPKQISQANLARRQLRNAKRASGKGKQTPTNIRDDRLVRGPRNAYTFFLADRWGSGDFKHMTISEASTLIGREWKGSNASSKKQFEEQSTADHARWVEEYTSVYGQAPPASREKAVSSA